MTVAVVMKTVLDEVRHKKIIADIERVCTVAGVQGRFMHESMTLYCENAEVNWVRHFWERKAKGCPGLILNGCSNPDTKCQAICAALLRNYIDARVIPFNSVLESHENGSAVSPTVLIIPNLYVSVTSKSLPAWKVQAMYDILLSRAVAGKPTVAYIEEWDALRKLYGKPFSDHLSGYDFAKPIDQ